MSLLMDALRKAELAKRQAQAGGETAHDKPPANALELTPLDAAPATPAGMQLDELQLEVLDDQFDTAPAAKVRHETPRRSATAPPGNAAAEDRARARNVFAAKQSPATGKLFGVVVTAVTLVAVAIIAMYFWLQMPATNSLTATNPGAAPIAAARPAPASRPLAAAPAAVTSPTAGTAAEAAPRPAKRKPPVAVAAAAPLPSSDGEAPIRVTTGHAQVNGTLSRAYEAFLAGDLATAAREYGAVLQGDPLNSDALLGLAAVRLRQGQPAAAEDLYLRTLAADPKNPLAQAGLIALHAQADPLQSETRLQTLIAAQPGLPVLHFVLGNVYAREGRWRDAQQSYFTAYSGDAGNPDYAFNLAVSLDRLRQAKLAAQYYNQALTAAASRPASFDRAQASERLHDLQP